jgi:hypothetical protein
MPAIATVTKSGWKLSLQYNEKMLTVDRRQEEE